MEKLCSSNMFSALSLQSDEEEEQEKVAITSTTTTITTVTLPKRQRKDGKGVSTRNNNHDCGIIASKGNNNHDSGIVASKGKSKEGEEETSNPSVSIAHQNSAEATTTTTTTHSSSSSSPSHGCVKKEMGGSGGRRVNGFKTTLKWPLVWIDLEMTGLDVEKDRILELACVITDGRLEKMIEGPALIINQPDELLANMGEWCRTQHAASGLVDAVRQSKVTEEDAEKQVIDFVREHTSTTVQPLLAGNSVYVDLIFLKKYMPSLAALFPHVVVDVSSIKALCFRWYRKDSERAPVKKKQHRALEDIKESIMELKYMQKTIFKKI